MYILLRERHCVVERRLISSKRLLLLLLKRLLLRLILDRNRNVFGSRLIRIVTHWHFCRLCRRVVLHNVDLHCVGANVRRFLHKRSRIVTFNINDNIRRLTQMVVSVLYRIKRLLVGVSLLILFLKRFYFQTSLVPLIIHAGKYENVENE